MINENFDIEYSSLDCDVLIIGSGMAGISSAIWSVRRALRPILIEESDRIGGQLHTVHSPITDYPACLPKNGVEFLSILEEQLKMLEIHPRLSYKLLSLKKIEREHKLPLWKSTWDVKGQTVNTIFSRAVVVATGLRKRKLPPFVKIIEQNVFYSAGLHRRTWQGKRIAILGGGDGAFENGVLLKSIASRVDMIYRSKKSRAAPCFIRKLTDNDHEGTKFFFHPSTELCEMQKQNDGIRLILKKEDRYDELDCDLLLVKIGFEPNSELFRNLLACREDGSILTDEECRSSVQGVWATGDICNVIDPSLSACAGHASVAVRSIERYLRDDL